MWEDARRHVAATFFKDTVEVYRIDVASDDIGEDIETSVLVGTYPCNVEDNSKSERTTESGTALPQALRVSTLKGLPLDNAHTYEVRLTSVRLALDLTEYWKVAAVVEGQISTVLTVQRKVSV